MQELEVLMHKETVEDAIRYLTDARIDRDIDYYSD